MSGGCSRASRDATSRHRWLAIAAGVLSLLAIACAKPQHQEIHDSLESVNRPVFNANKTFDDYAFGPVARGWKFITPGVLRRSLTNAARNLTFPQRFVSSVGQAEFERAGTELGRFLVNSTVGVGGLFDPATRVGIGRYDDDIGKMLARWNVPPGPYIVIPILGPSTPRDALGYLANIALNPLVWAGVTVPPIGILFAVNRRAELDDQIRNAQEASLDYYVFVRDAYVQRRTRFIRNEYVTLPESDELATDVYSYPDDLYELPGDSGPADASAPFSAPCEAVVAGEATDDCS